MKIELNLIKGFMIKYLIAFLGLMLLMFFIGYIQSVLPEDSSGWSILFGVLLFLMVLSSVAISFTGLCTRFLDKPEYYIVRYKTRTILYLYKSLVGLLFFVVMMIVLLVVNNILESLNDTVYVFDFLSINSRYRSGEFPKGFLLSTLFIFRFMSSLSYSNQLKIKFNVPTYILTSSLYLLLFLSIMMFGFFIQASTQYNLIYFVILITYTWDYILIKRSDV